MEALNCFTVMWRLMSLFNYTSDKHIVHKYKIKRGKRGLTELFGFEKGFIVNRNKSFGRRSNFCFNSFSD